MVNKKGEDRRVAAEYLRSSSCINAVLVVVVDDEQMRRDLTRDVRLSGQLQVARLRVVGSLLPNGSLEIIGWV